MKIQQIASNDYSRTRWANGLGWTREIYRDHEQDWHWRASVAEIKAESEFSKFPKCQRVMVLLSGAGVVLKFQNSECVQLLPPHQRYQFSGESVLHGAAIDNQQAQVLNLFWRSDQFEAQVFHRPLAGSMAFVSEPKVLWFVFVLSGSAVFAGRSDCATLAIADSAILEPESELTNQPPQILEGGAELILLRLKRRD